MRNIADVIFESKPGALKKLDMLTIMVAYQMWKEYELYDEFFGKLSKEELEDYNDLINELERLDNDNSRVQFSRLKEWYPLLNKTADYVLSCPDDEFSKSDKRIWKEIKTHVE